MAPIVRHYLMSGLVVSSDIAMPGMIETDRAGVDIRIHRGTVSRHLDDAEDSGPNWQKADDRFLLQVPGIVRFELTGGHTMVWQTEDGTPTADAAIFLCGSGFGLLMQQRGHCVLHASAVEMDGKVILLSGPSGAGKSTLAAGLIKAGGRLVADDQVNLTVAGHDLSVYPDGRAMRLWQQAIDRLDLEQGKGTAVRADIAKFHVMPRHHLDRPVPLGALYILRETRATDLKRQGQPITIRRLNLPDAAMAVRQNAFRPAMVGRFGQEGLYLRAAALIERAGGVYHLTRPLDFAAMDAVVARLREHRLGLGPA
jgi:hypothetical protein